MISEIFLKAHFYKSIENDQQRKKYLNVISIIKILDQELSLIIKNSWMNHFLSDFQLVETKLFKGS